LLLFTRKVHHTQVQVHLDNLGAKCRYFHKNLVRIS